MLFNGRPAHTMLSPVWIYLSTAVIVQLESSSWNETKLIFLSGMICPRNLIGPNSSLWRLWPLYRYKWSTVRIKLIVYVEMMGWSWLVGVVNGISDSMLCLTRFLVLRTTCYVCIQQQVFQSNTMKEHI